MIRSTTWLLAELAVLFFGVTFLVQIFKRRMGAERVRSWMGGHPFVAALKGIAIGFMTPFCTFTAIPMLIGLRQAGVPPAGYVAFTVAAPVLDPVLFGALVLIVGLEAAVIYFAVAFVAAVSLAMFAQAIDIERYMRPIETSGLVTAAAVPTVTGPGSGLLRDCPDMTSGCSETPDLAWAGLRTEALAAATAAVSLLRTMGPLLLVGVGVSLLIDAVVSPDVTAELTRFNAALAVPVAATIGTPLYVSTGVFVPIADSLRAAGVGIGAIVALTIAGAGANIPEFVILSRLAKPRVIAVFFLYVFGVAVAGGFLAQAVVAT